MTLRRAAFTAILAFGLGGCLTAYEPQTEPVPQSEAEKRQTDDMYRQCKDKKKNRKDRFCVIKPGGKS